MNKKEIKAAIAERLSAGTKKSEVFAQLSGQDVKDGQLAYMIASYPDPRRCAEHDRKVDILLVLMFIQAFLGAIIGFALGMKIGPNAAWILGAIMALIPLLFAWGFYKDSAGTYNAYILLSAIQLFKSFDGFSASPLTSSIVFAINLGLLVYVWYVRQRLFPDFGFMTPVKQKGQYVFKD